MLTTVLMIAGLIIAILSGIQAPATLLGVVVISFVLGKGIELLGNTKFIRSPRTYGGGRPGNEK